MGSIGCFPWISASRLFMLEGSPSVRGRVPNRLGGVAYFHAVPNAMKRSAASLLALLFLAVEVAAPLSVARGEGAPSPAAESVDLFDAMKSGSVDATFVAARTLVTGRALWHRARTRRLVWPSAISMVVMAVPGIQVAKCQYFLRTRLIVSRALLPLLRRCSPAAAGAHAQASATSCAGVQPSDS